MNTPLPAAGAVVLTHLGVIRAQGADATKFLQSQLTSDVASLDATQAGLAGFCSAKGRLQASFIVWKAADEDVFLVCASNVLPATLKRLSMFVLRAKCKLSDASAEFRLLGRIAETGLDVTPPWTASGNVADGVQVRLPDAAGRSRFMSIGSASASAPEAGDDLSLDAWRWLEVQSGVPLIEAATVDRFVPQMLNYELLGGVDFQKGCYPGQEVVARSQYRGTLKRRMFLFDSEASLAPGDEIFHPADPEQPAGMVVNAAPNPTGGCSALVEAKLSLVEDGALHAGAASGPPLVRRPLPYAIA